MKAKWFQPRIPSWHRDKQAGADLPLGWKGLSLGSQISGGPKILEEKTISSISVSIIFVFCFGSMHVFLSMQLTKDLCRSMSVKDWSEWRWAFSFSGVENWLLLHIMCRTKLLNPFFQITRGQSGRLLNKYVMAVWRDNFTAGFFVSFIVDVFAPDIVAAAQHCPPKCLQRSPMVISKRYINVTAHPEAKWP